jgi:predicted nucleic acid-binding protein
MESALLGLVLDSSVLIAAERKKLTTTEAIKKVRDDAGDVPIVICSMTVAELGQGIYRADTPERSRMRRQFLDELKTHVPVHPVTESARSKLRKESLFRWPISSSELARWNSATRSAPSTSEISAASPA